MILQCIRFLLTLAKEQNALRCPTGFTPQTERSTGGRVQIWPHKLQLSSSNKRGDRAYKRNFTTIIENGSDISETFIASCKSAYFTYENLHTATGAYILA